MFDEMIQALEAVLLFHSGGEWTGSRQAQWEGITGEQEATTKVLCDHVRHVLHEAKAVAY